MQLIKIVFVDPASQRTNAGAGIAVGLTSGHTEQKYFSWLMQARVVAVLMFNAWR